MKIALIVINTIALVLTVFWAKESNYEYEPLILGVTLIATLVTLLFNQAKATKDAKVKGKENMTVQNSEGAKADIDGDRNITFQ